MNRKVRLGLIGAGAIGSTHAAAALASKSVHLAAICDPDSMRAIDLAQKSGAAAYGSMIAMVENEQLDGVIVATPPNTHAPVVHYVASRGLHALCEKPLATSIDAARSMVDAAAQHGTILTMASKFRFVDDLRYARDLVQSGSAGDLLMIENAFTATVMMGSRWNSDPEIAGGGVIMDNGTHAVDIFRFLGGPVTDVSAQEYRRYQRLAVEDTAMIFARCANGAVATSDLSWTIDKRLPHYLRLHCQDATIELGWKCSRIQRAGEQSWTDFGTGYSKLASFAELQDNFAAAVRGREALAVGTEDALASVVAIDEAYRSLDVERVAWA